MILILMENPRHWRLSEQRYRLVGEVCPDCDKKLFPPRDICPGCHGEVKIPYTFSGKGEIYSYTQVHQPPEGFEDQAPYPIALVKLEEGPLVTAQLTDLDPQGKIEIGTPVEAVIRKLRTDGKNGMIIYGYKFRPTLKQLPPQPPDPAKK